MYYSGCVRHTRVRAPLVDPHYEDSLAPCCIFAGTSFGFCRAGPQLTLQARARQSIRTATMMLVPYPSRHVSITHNVLTDRSPSPPSPLMKSAPVSRAFI